MLGALYSVARVSAGLDVEELSNEVNLNAGGDDDHEDLHDGPRADVAVVVFDESEVARLPRT